MEIITNHGKASVAFSEFRNDIPRDNLRSLSIWESSGWVFTASKRPSQWLRSQRALLPMFAYRDQSIEVRSMPV